MRSSSGFHLNPFWVIFRMAFHIGAALSGRFVTSKKGTKRVQGRDHREEDARLYFLILEHHFISVGVKRSGRIIQAERDSPLTAWSFFSHAEVLISQPAAAAPQKAITSVRALCAPSEPLSLIQGDLAGRGWGRGGGFHCITESIMRHWGVKH